MGGGRAVAANVAYFGGLTGVDFDGIWPAGGFGALVARRSVYWRNTDSRGNTSSQGLACIANLLMLPS